MTSAGFEPLIRSALDVYLDRRQNSLVYIRGGCSPPAARLSTEGIPVVGRPFRVSLSGWVKAKGMSNRQRWQWERGNDTEGWVKIPFQPGRRRTYEYTPMAADVGYSLRAFLAYTDNGGNQVRVTTEPSSPVALAAQPLIGPRMSRTSAFFFLHLFPPTGLPSMGRGKTFSASNSPRIPSFRFSWMSGAWPSGFRFLRLASPESAPVNPPSKALSGKPMSVSVI